MTIFTNVCGAATVFLVNESDISVLNKIILFVVNQYSVIMQRNCPWLFMFAEKFSNRAGLDPGIFKRGVLLKLFQQS